MPISMGSTQCLDINRSQLPLGISSIGWNSIGFLKMENSSRMIINNVQLFIHDGVKELMIEDKGRKKSWKVIFLKFDNLISKLFLIVCCILDGKVFQILKSLLEHILRQLRNISWWWLSWTVATVRVYLIFHVC